MAQDTSNHIYPHPGQQHGDGGYQDRRQQGDSDDRERHMQAQTPKKDGPGTANLLLTVRPQKPMRFTDWADI